MNPQHRETTKRDAKILELKETLESVLQRYKDLSYMETPEWDFNEEIPVRDARRVLKDEYSQELYEEFYQLRKVARALQIKVKYGKALNRTTKEGMTIQDLDVDVEDFEDLLERYKNWSKKTKDRLTKYLSIKS